MKENIVKALCNPARLQILKCISKKEKTVAELIKTCGLSQSSVSQHLIKLKKAGLVKDRREGRKIYYSLKSKDVGKVSNLILNLSERIK